ncbi:hypothetical protein [Seonamhaeicola marinus]|uniref:Uncharacterized protein n=1 Tax=Seonamhaeicola marinus TaxID=1912246 RepID=A0A5D0HKN5_9FLAO|nr:hypothetical protein [Seonamhaeicola marinus]TYA71825.1 hypothetical protein FUA24_19940 [Seonamhaeicola marinus]
MKHLSRLLMLAALVIFVSCQNENLTEDQSIEEVQADLSPDEDFEAAESTEGSLQLNEESEKLVVPSKSSLFAKYGSSCTPDLDGFRESLPEVVSITTTTKRGPEAYFTLDILDTNLAGTDLLAWCADIDLNLEVEGPLDFDVYSSYGDNIPDSVFAQPDNLDVVNWILNQDYVGSESPNGGTYEYGHVQWAIWELLNSYNCNICDNLTNPTGTWRDDSRNLEKAKEILNAAVENGQDFVPACGQKIGVVLVPDGKQPLIVMKEVPSIEECSDCEGKVTELTLEFDWKYAKRIKIYQKKENTCWGAKIFDKVVQPGEEFTINGVNHDGSFGRYIYIYVGNKCYYYTKIKTNCDLKIGPGYERGVFNVVSGRSSKGGELCEYVKPEYNCWRYRHWSSYYYYKYRYQNHGY